MKKNVKVTLNFQIEYPDLNETKKINREFESWLKSWLASAMEEATPVLYKSCQEYCPVGQASGSIHIDGISKVYKHGKI